MHFWPLWGLRLHPAFLYMLKNESKSFGCVPHFSSSGWLSWRDQDIHDTCTCAMCAVCARAATCTTYALFEHAQPQVTCYCCQKYAIQGPQNKKRGCSNNNDNVHTTVRSNGAANPAEVVVSTFGFQTPLHCRSKNNMCIILSCILSTRPSVRSATGDRDWQPRPAPIIAKMGGATPMSIPPMAHQH